MSWVWPFVAAEPGQAVFDPDAAELIAIQQVDLGMAEVDPDAAVLIA